MTDYSWQSSKHRYCGRIEFADNKLATQIVNASTQLAQVSEQLTKLNAAMLFYRTEELKTKYKEQHVLYRNIEADIRILAKGRTIDEP